MKKLVYTLSITLLVIFSVNHSIAQKKGNEIVCYKSNMDCADCEKTVTEYLKFEKGVKDLKVDHVSNTILVEYKTGKNTKEGYAKAINKKGYQAEIISKEEYDKIVAKAKSEGQVHITEEHKERK